jgi:hypothetical protein
MRGETGKIPKDLGRGITSKKSAPDRGRFALGI